MVGLGVEKVGDFAENPNVGALHPYPGACTQPCVVRVHVAPSSVGAACEADKKLCAPGAARLMESWSVTNSNMVE